MCAVRWLLMQVPLPSPDPWQDQPAKRG